MALLGKLHIAAVNISACTGIPKGMEAFLHLSRIFGCSKYCISLGGLLSIESGQTP